MLVSAIQQHESAVSTCMPPPIWASPHLPPRPTPLGWNRVPHCNCVVIQQLPCVIQQLAAAICFMHCSAYVSIHPTLSFPHCVQSLFSVSVPHSFILQKLNHITQFCSLFYLTVYVYCCIHMYSICILLGKKENKTVLYTGEGNGNPLRCSCLENPRDGGAW